LHEKIHFAICYIKLIPFISILAAIFSVRNYKAGYSEWTFKWNEWDDYVDPEKFKQQERYKEL